MRPFPHNGVQLGLVGASLLTAHMASSAIVLNIDDTRSIKSAAGTASYGMMKYYNANQTGGVPGNLPDPYYWWHCGSMMMSLVEYWSLTGDSTYNDQVVEAIEWQSGPNGDFMTPNQTTTTGNDDQAFWGFAAMDAAELNFPNPPSDKYQYLGLAQGVFNTQVARWDDSTCEGGLRWQVFPFNAGWNYKNSISNGCFFSLGARLARYTGNTTYAEQAEKAYDWMETVGLVDQNYTVWDGADAPQNCTAAATVRNSWSYNSAVLLHGAANMWNISTTPAAQTKWRTVVDGLLAKMSTTFFNDDIMGNYECETPGTCNLDMQFFKAFTARWMAATTQLCPWTYDTVMPLLRASAAAAAQQCSGPDGACGLRWWREGEYDGLTGIGQQMAAMSVFANLLVQQQQAPVTHDTGGTSIGNPAQGGELTSPYQLTAPPPITMAERAGAGILTVGVLGMLVGGAVWLVW